MGMEVQEQMNPIVHRDSGEFSCRYEKELVSELPLFRHPCQRCDVGACRRHERGLPDRYPRLTPASLARHTQNTGRSEPERLAGRLSARLEFADVDDDAAAAALLSEVTAECARIHHAVYDTFVAYSLELNLPV